MRWSFIAFDIRRIASAMRLRDDRGVAAVEFALIAPVMIGLYLSTVVTTKAYMASRKVALVARALADITSRQAVGATTNCTPTNAANPCVGNTDIANYFAAAATIMAPYTTSSLKMTLSRIDVIPDASNNLWAYTKWSVINNGGVARPCNGGATNNPYVTGSPSSPTPSGTSTMSTANRPLVPGTMSVTTTGYQNDLAQQYTSAGAPQGFLIVADIVYTYTPGFTFKVFNWSNLTSFTTGWTQAFWSRTGLPIDGHSLSTNATLCAANDPNNT